ncbi:MAG: hypothetical protein HQL32_10035 [Planctomycetes bacterium]|nr:hypothetical protein [Planctomycetota bacterium]
MSATDYSQLDEAWEFIEQAIGNNTPKNQIAPMLNEKGYRTIKGKEWTYQTLMLEQRRRKEMQGEEQSDTEDASRVTIHDDAPQKNVNYALIFAQNKLDNGETMPAVVVALHEHGYLDAKGREWNEHSLAYALADKLIDANNTPVENKSIMDIIDGHKTRSRSVASRGKNPLAKSLNVVEESEDSEDIGDGQDQAHKTDEAWQFCLEKMEAGLKKKDIVTLLNDNGYKTRNNKKWTYQTLMLEQKKRKSSVGLQMESQQRLDKTTLAGFEDTAAGSIEYARSIVLKKIIRELNNAGRKTSKGRPWTYQVLLLELLKYTIEPELDYPTTNTLGRIKTKKKKDGEDQPNLFDFFGEA